MDVLLVSESLKTYTDYPLHQHRNWEIIFSLEGKGTMQIKDQYFPFREGTVFCIPPWTPHKKTSPEGFKDGCMFVSDLMLSPETDFLVFEDEPEKPVLSMFRFAYNTQLKNEPNAREIINAVGEVVLQILIQNSSLKPSPNREKIERFKNLLLEHMEEPDYRAADAIQQLGYSESYFRKVCKETLNCTPVEYLTKLRIEHAKQLLKQYRGIRSISEIAENAGFSDPYYFSRKFHQVTGLSPREYANGENERIELTLEESPDRDLDPEYRMRRQNSSS